MRISTAQVRTDHAESYMRKLGQHWSHRFPVVFEASIGCKIEMPNATCKLRAEPEHLDVHLMLELETDQERLEQVVEEHIKRFAFREELEFRWNRESS